MATYREGWKDGVRYVAAMIRKTSWDPETRKRLYALASLSLDIAPEAPPPADANWRSSVPRAVEEKAPAPPKDPPAP